MKRTQSQLRGPPSRSKHLLREFDGKTFSSFTESVKRAQIKEGRGVGRRVLRMRLRAARALLSDSVRQQALVGALR